MRHAGKSMLFDWSTTANIKDGKAIVDDAPMLKWAAFYSDCEHEVHEVTAGYRLTLTYNLYVSGSAGSLAGQPTALDPVDVILTALPAGTVSGAPKVRAMQIIDELEREKRGVGYAGAAGYVSAAGEVDTCIVLRTALFKDGMIYVQAGGGVVADSDPDAEYEETLHKSRALRRAAAEAWRFA